MRTQFAFHRLLQRTSLLGRRQILDPRAAARQLLLNRLLILLGSRLEGVALPAEGKRAG